MGGNKTVQNWLKQNALAGVFVYFTPSASRTRSIATEPQTIFVFRIEYSKQFCEWVFTIMVLDFKMYASL